MLVSTPKNYASLVLKTYCLKTPANMDKLLHGSDMLRPMVILWTPVGF